MCVHKCPFTVVEETLLESIKNATRSSRLEREHYTWFLTIFSINNKVFAFKTGPADRDGRNHIYSKRKNFQKTPIQTAQFLRHILYNNP